MGKHSTIFLNYTWIDISIFQQAIGHLQILSIECDMELQRNCKSWNAQF